MSQNTNTSLSKTSKIMLGVSSFLLLGGVFLLQSFANSSSTVQFDLKSNYLGQYFSKVHFNVGGNDFGGGFFWLPAENLSTPQEIRVGNQIKECSMRVRGYYYNAQRGERLWPLDETSKKELQQIDSRYANVTVSNWFFTNCVGVITGDVSSGHLVSWGMMSGDILSWNMLSGVGASGAGLTGVELPLVPDTVFSLTGDIYAIYGMITHRDAAGREYFLMAGLGNDPQNNQLLSPRTFRCNLQRIENRFPLGYIYDSAGGIALVGASIKSDLMYKAKTDVWDYKKIMDFHSAFSNKLTQSKCIEDFYHFSNEDRTKIVGPWTDLLDFGDGDATTTLMGLGIRGIVGLSKEVSVSYQQGIQGNVKDTSLLLSTDTSIANVINFASKNSEILCRNKRSKSYNNGASIICLNEGITLSADKIAGKTIIIKEWNLTLTSYMASNANPATIYLAKGDLVLPKKVTTLTKFAANGYLNESGEMQAGFLKGNFIVNGLIQGNGGSEVENKVIIHGKLASFNTINTPSDQTMVRLTKILWDVRNKKIGLTDIFVWKCVDGKGSDDTPCTINENERGNAIFLIDKSFGLIDMNFASSLFQ